VCRSTLLPLELSSLHLHRYTSIELFNLTVNPRLEQKKYPSMLHLNLRIDSRTSKIRSKKLNIA
jgi:hypothetical protein